MTVVTERHEATVRDTNDPEERGRIIVSCPSLLGDDETKLPDFIEPSYDWGWFVVPNVGEIVEIEIIVTSEQDEQTSQAFLEAPNFRWRQKRFYDTEADEPAAPIHPDFQGDGYGQKRGFATPNGQILIFDDAGSLIRMSWMADREADESKRTSLVLEKNKATVVVSKDHSIVLEPDKTTVTLSDGNAMTLVGKEGAATAKFGDGEKHVTIVETLETFYTGSVKTSFDTHVHLDTALRTMLTALGADMAALGTAVGVGATSAAAITAYLATTPPVAPEVPSSPHPSWDSAINSSKVSIPDG